MRRLRRQSETDFDRILAGKADGGDAENLGQFVWKVRAAYSQAPQPQLHASHLSAILREVESARLSGESLAPELYPDTAPMRSSGWRKLVLRGAGASMALKIIGGTVAFAGTAGGLAAFEALPQPAQGPVATAVELVTPFDLPGNEETKVNNPAGDLKVDETPPPQVPPAPNPKSQFGQDVSGDAKDAGISGSETSDKAGEHGQQHQEESQAQRPAKVPPGPHGLPAPPHGAGSPAQNRGKAEPHKGYEKAPHTPAGQQIAEDPPGRPAVPPRP